MLGESSISTIAKYEALAASLGADLEAPALVEAKDAYSTKFDALEQVIATKPDLKVLIMTGVPTDQAYFVTPNADGIAREMKDLGLNLIEPTELDAENLYLFEAVSWENIGKYPADLILVDSRQDLAAWADIPTWSALPAVKAGQVGTWFSVYPYSYQKLNPVLESMAETISKAEVIL